MVLVVILVQLTDQVVHTRNCKPAEKVGMNLYCFGGGNEPVFLVLMDFA